MASLDAVDQFGQNRALDLLGVHPDDGGYTVCASDGQVRFNLNVEPAVILLDRHEVPNLFGGLRSAVGEWSFASRKIIVHLRPVSVVRVGVVDCGCVAHPVRERVTVPSVAAYP